MEEEKEEQEEEEEKEEENENILYQEQAPACQLVALEPQERSSSTAIRTSIVGSI